MTSRFRVNQIDHVELFVPDRHEAAAWYSRVLGLETLAAYREWAEDKRGPLMISSDGGNTKLALFERDSAHSRTASGIHLVAFRIDGEGFMTFLDRLGEIEVRDDKGRALTAAAVVDHDQAFSIYFVDPYGHNLEVTTYDHESTRAALMRDKLL